MSGHVDEETPLLTGNHEGRKQATPLPRFQFTILMFLQLVEPLTSSVIYPFAPQLVRDIGITHGNESQVGHYVGLLISVFFLTQAFTVLYWSRMSDRIGRKPVILIGLFGISMSMFCFGLSTTFWGLLLSRILNGALNGNSGVLKSIIVEMTDSTNIAQVYAYIPISWSAGAMFGSIVGGMLSRPAERFPDLFGDNIFLKKYPYFLPCSIPAIFSLISWLVAFLFLEETRPSTISIGRLFNITTDRKKPTPPNDIGSTHASAATASSQHDNHEDHCRQPLPLPLRSLLIPRVLIATGNCASLALVDMAFRAIQPVFLSAPIPLGGLGLPPPSIGTLLCVQGILNGVFQVFFFARIHDRWGSKKSFIAGIASAIPAFVMFPVANSFARTQGYSVVVWIAIGLQVIASISTSLSFSSIYIFVSAASPNPASVGATYGLSVLSVSITRAIGPAGINTLFSLSIEKGYLGGNLVYYVLIFTSGAALAFSSMLPDQIETAS